MLFCERKTLLVPRRISTEKIRVQQHELCNERTTVFHGIAPHRLDRGVDGCKRVSAIEQIVDEVELCSNAHKLLKQCDVTLLAFAFAPYEDALSWFDRWWHGASYPMVGTAPYTPPIYFR